MEVFASVVELLPAFEKLFARPTQLQLVVGEMFSGTSRLVDEDAEATDMAGLEHLGTYVFEMTKARIEMLKTEENVLPRVIEDDEEIDSDGDVKLESVYGDDDNEDEAEEQKEEEEDE
jgi:intron-binding protein aquarius